MTELDLPAHAFLVFDFELGIGALRILFQERVGTSGCVFLSANATEDVERGDGAGITPDRGRQILLSQLFRRPEQLSGNWYPQVDEEEETYNHSAGAMDGVGHTLSIRG